MERPTAQPSVSSLAPLKPAWTRSWSTAFLGWPFALFKVVGAAVTGIIGGTLADKFSVSSTTDYNPDLVNAAPPGLRPALNVEPPFYGVSGAGLS